MKTFEDFRREVLTVIDEQFDGSMVDYIYSLQCKIKRVEAERDQLLKDIKQGCCRSCIGWTKGINHEPCLHCHKSSNYVWRGIPEQEKTDGQM